MVDQTLERATEAALEKLKLLPSLGLPRDVLRNVVKLIVAAAAPIIEEDVAGVIRNELWRHDLALVPLAGSEVRREHSPPGTHSDGQDT